MRFKLSKSQLEFQLIQTHHEHLHQSERKSRLVDHDLKSISYVVLNAGVGSLPFQGGISLFHAEFLGTDSKMTEISMLVFSSAFVILESKYHKNEIITSTS